MAAYIDQQGYLVAPGVQARPRPHIEHGELTIIKGIIVHQTDSDSADATLNSYLRAGANGAHFLIDRDGMIYQTASLKKKTWHVGNLKSKCLALHTCTAAELPELQKNAQKPTALNRIEMRKSVPDRYPGNNDAIGIEIVGKCILPKEYIKENMSADAIQRLRGEKGVFEPINIAQTAALQRLVVELTALLQVPEDQIFRHPEVSRKNPTEAASAQWK